EAHRLAHALHVAELEQALADHRGHFAGAVQRQGADGARFAVGHPQGLAVGRQAAGLGELRPVQGTVVDVLAAAAGERIDPLQAMPCGSLKVASSKPPSLNPSLPLPATAIFLPPRSVMTIRWCVLSAMNSRLPAWSASTLPGKNKGLSPDSLWRASSNLSGF